MGIGCIDPHFLDLGTSWRWVVSFTPRPLYHWGNSPRYPLDRRLGGPQSQSGRREEGKILDPSGLTRPARSQSQYRLRYPGSISYLLRMNIRLDIMFSNSLNLCAFFHVKYNVTQPEKTNIKIIYYCQDLRGCVTYNTGIGLDVSIYCTLYIHNSGLQAIQCYRYSTHFPFHRYTSTRIISLH
jgi:hypothetical protein